MGSCFHEALPCECKSGVAFFFRELVLHLSKEKDVGCAFRGLSFSHDEAADPKGSAEPTSSPNQAGTLPRVEG